MADDAKKDDKKDEKKDAKKDAKPAAEGAPGKSIGLVPIIAALAVLVAIGVGGSWYVLKSLTPAPVEKPGEATAGDAGGEAHGGGDAKGGADAHGTGAGLLATGKELDPISLKGNITGSGGTRYVTLDVGLWVPKHDHPTLNDASVRRLIQARLEETLKTYQLEDLGSPNILARMRKDFAGAIERLLRTSVDPARKPENKYILETTVTSLLTQ